MHLRSHAKYLAALFITAIIVISCSDDDGTQPNTPEEITPITMTFVDPPFTLLDTTVKYARDVSYGPYDENLFDIFLVDSDEPTPLVVYIHGGGFTTGTKGIVYINMRDDIRKVLAADVSYATINYRLLEDVDKDGVLKSLGDSKRCLQFFRYHHEQLNIDPDKIALYGASAGAGTSLWLATSDDMAEPASTEPVMRQSTHIPVVGLKGAQATYDLVRWETDVFKSLGMTLEEMAALPNTSEAGLLSFYGVDSLEELATEECRAYRAKVDMLALMSADDPPIWVMNNIENTGVPTELGELMHHTLHAVAVKDRADEVGLECQMYAPPLGIADPANQDIIEFLLEKLKQ